jgi:hypothetical protein
MTALERRYRRLLWLLPARHRHAYGDELIGLLLDLGSDRTRPNLAEVFSVITLALRLRLREPAGWPRTAASIVLTAALVVAGTRQAGLQLALLPDGVVVLSLPSHDLLIVGVQRFEGAVLTVLSIAAVSLLAPLAWVSGARRTALILYLALFGSQVLPVAWGITFPVPALWYLWPLAALAALRWLPPVRPRALWAALVPLVALTWAGVAEAVIAQPAGWMVVAIVAICAAALVGVRRGWAVLAGATVAGAVGGWLLSATSQGSSAGSMWFWSSHWPSVSQWLLVAVVVAIGATAHRTLALTGRYKRRNERPSSEYAG